MVACERFPWGDLDVTVPLGIFTFVWVLALVVGGVLSYRGPPQAIDSVPATALAMAFLVGPFMAMDVLLWRVRMLPGKVWTDGFRPAIGSVGGVGESYRLRGRLRGKTRWTEVASVRVYRRGPRGQPVALHVLFHNGERLLIAFGARRDGDGGIAAIVLDEWRMQGGAIEEAEYPGHAVEDPPWFRPPQRSRRARLRSSP